MVHHLACGSRDRCYRRSAPFRDAFLDIHNLVPAEGDLNGIRSNRPVGEVRGEGRRFGDCGAEVGRDRFEPPDDRRGDAARIVFLMRDRHGIPIEPRDMRVLTRWNRQDPVDQRERARDRMIQQVLAGSR
jgi:deoxyribonuclease-1